MRHNSVKMPSRIMAHGQIATLVKVYKYVKFRQICLNSKEVIDLIKITVANMTSQASELQNNVKSYNNGSSLEELKMMLWSKNCKSRIGLTHL